MKTTKQNEMTNQLFLNNDQQVSSNYENAMIESLIEPIIEPIIFKC